MSHFNDLKTSNLNIPTFDIHKIFTVEEVRRVYLFLRSKYPENKDQKSASLQYVEGLLLALEDIMKSAEGLATAKKKAGNAIQPIVSQYIKDNTIQRVYSDGFQSTECPSEKEAKLACIQKYFREMDALPKKEIELQPLVTDKADEEKSSKESPLTQPAVSYLRAYFFWISSLEDETQWLSMVNKWKDSESPSNPTSTPSVAVLHIKDEKQPSVEEDDMDSNDNFVELSKIFKDTHARWSRFYDLTSWTQNTTLCMMGASAHYILAFVIWETVGSLSHFSDVIATTAFTLAMEATIAILAVQNLTKLLSAPETRHSAALQTHILGWCAALSLSLASLISYTLLSVPDVHLSYESLKLLSLCSPLIGLGASCFIVAVIYAVLHATPKPELSVAPNSELMATMLLNPW